MSAADMTTAFWGMTINNYDETDLALVQQGYPDHVRQIVYTLEKGESGTPHIQAFIRLYRQQRLSYMKKLFPRGSFKALMAEEYKLNAQRYAQKLDKTAESAAVITNNPFPDPVVEAISVIRDVLETYAHSNDVREWRKWTATDLHRYKRSIEFIRVEERPNLAKFYVSPMYSRVWDVFAGSLLNHVCRQRERELSGHTHTHTHTREKISREGGITTDDAVQDDQGEDDYSSQSSPREDGEGEGDEDCEGTSTDDTGSSGTDCSSDSQADD